MSLRLEDLADIIFYGDEGERELCIPLHIAVIRHLSANIEAKFQNATRLGLIWHTEPELVLLWLAILASGREPLLIQYPNEKQNMAHWRESVAASINAAALGGLIIADDARMKEIDFVETYCPEPRAFTVTDDEGKKNGELHLDGAFLQMSSGTTGHRKPIRFELSAVATHIDRFNRVLGLVPQDRIASWLPLYHDMGFIACFLMPLLLGIPVVLIDPMKWVRRPALLSEAIRRHGCTICYMPNFGFEIMSRQAERSPMPTMRHWISCSEPAYPETMQRFSKAFGIPEKALSVCYAMAENIFAVTFRSGMREFNSGGRSNLSCGKPIPGTEISIREQGEIWVRSEISLRGYFNSESVVDADGYYPTGDLGETIEGELVVTGRKRDLINIAGRKYMLNNLDQALQVLSPEAKGRTATIPWRNDRLGTEIPLLLIETEDFYLRTDQNVLGSAFERATSIEAAEVAFVPPRFIVKTSSGKINRANTAEHYRRVLAWQKEGCPAHKKGIEESLDEYCSPTSWKRPVSELFDSLGLTSLSILLDEFDIPLNPEMSLEDHLDHYRKTGWETKENANGSKYYSIVSLADARLTRPWNEQHIEALSRTVGCPVRFEYLCLPPIPVLLSDIVFHDYFLPREENKAKYQNVIRAIRKLKKASIVLVDDVAELLFGESFFPFLDHRLHRSEQADLLIYRWQQYAQNHHNLPIGVANLFGTTHLRNEYIDRLEKYLRVPIFRIATLISSESITRDWDYIERVNADWTMALNSDTAALVETLANFMCSRKADMPECRRSVSESDARSKIRHIGGPPHFCSMVADKRKLDELIERYDRFCIFGPKASLPYLREKLEAQGKSYVISDKSTDLRSIENQFDCVVQTGTTGRPITSKPVFQIFWAAWEYETHAHPEAYAGLNPSSFHAAPQNIGNELGLIRNSASPDKETGEKAMSIAMILSERLAGLDKEMKALSSLGEKYSFAPIDNPHGFLPRRDPTEEDYATYRRCDDLIVKGRKTEALHILKQLADDGPYIWEVYNDLGSLLIEQKNFEAGIPALKTAVSLEFGSTFSLQNLFFASAMNGEVGQAIAAAHAMLRRNPQDSELPIWLADLVREANIRPDDLSWVSKDAAKIMSEIEELRKEARIGEMARKQLALTSGFLKQLRVLLKGNKDGSIESLPSSLQRISLHLPPLHLRKRPSIMLVLPPATASLAVQRILSKLSAGKYEILSPEYKSWAAGNTGAAPETTFEPEGRIYWWFSTNSLANALEKQGLSLSEFKSLMVFRDPRDSVVSMYHLTKNPEHLKMAQASCSADMFEHSKKEADRIASMAVDDYAIENIGWWNSNIVTAKKLCSTAPPHQICHLSYALLCEDFPQFLARLVGFLGFPPDKQVIDEMLDTEDVKKKGQLNPASLAHSHTASPYPGRHKRELKEGSLPSLNSASMEARYWLASVEEPCLRNVYID